MFVKARKYFGVLLIVASEWMFAIKDAENPVR